MPRLMRRLAGTAVVAGTASRVADRDSRRHLSHWSEQVEEQAHEESANQEMTEPLEPAGSTEIGEDRRLDQMSQLGEPHSADVLTDAEFEAHKAMILAE